MMGFLMEGRAAPRPITACHHEDHEAPLCGFTKNKKGAGSHGATRRRGAKNSNTPTSTAKNAKCAKINDQRQTDRKYKNVSHKAAKPQRKHNKGQPQEAQNAQDLESHFLPITITTTTTVPLARH